MNSATLKIAIEVDDKGSVKLRQLGNEAENAGNKGGQGLGKVSRSLGEIDGLSGKAVTALKGIGVAAVAIGGTAVLGGLYALTRALRESVKLASDMEEAQSKFNVVFGELSGQAEEWSNTLVKSYAMSTLESKKYLAAMQDLLVPMGMNKQAAAEMSFEVVKLSADMGSFNNVPTAQVMDDIQSALVGNYETMKKYGVVLNEATVQEKALAMGLARTKDSITAADKAQAAYALIVKGSAAAVGDMARTSDGFANQMKKLEATLTDLKIAAGEALLPVINELVTGLNDWLKANDEVLKRDIKGFVEKLIPVIEASAKAFVWLVAQMYNTLYVMESLGIVNGVLIHDINQQADKLGGLASAHGSAQAAIDGHSMASAHGAKNSADFTAAALAELRGVDNLVSAHGAAVEASNQLFSAHGQSAAATKNLGDASGDAAPKIEGTGKSLAAARKAAEDHARALQGLLDKYLPLEKELNDAKVAEQGLNELRDKGVLVGKRYETAMDNLRDSIRLTTLAHAGLTREMMDTGKAIGMEIPQWAEGYDLLALKMQEYAEKTPEEWEKANEKITQLQEDLVNDLGRIMEGFISDVLHGEIDSIEDLFSGLFDSILDMFARMLAQMAANSIIEAIFGTGTSGGLTLGSGIAALFGGGGGKKGGGVIGTGLSSASTLYSGYQYLTGGSSLLPAEMSGVSVGGSVGGGSVGYAGTVIGSAAYEAAAAEIAASAAAEAAAEGMYAGAYGGSVAAEGAGAGVGMGAGVGTAAVAGVFALGISLWARQMMKADIPPLAELLNSQGIGPEYFADVVGDSFRASVNPITGGTQAMMLDAESAILTVSKTLGLGIRATGDEVNDVMLQVFDQATGQWVDLGKEIMAFGVLADNMGEDAAAAMIEAKSGVVGLAEELLSISLAQETSLDRAIDSMEELGIKGGDLKVVLGKVGDIMSGVTKDTGDLRAELYDLGFAADQADAVISQLGLDVFNTTGVLRSFADTTGTLDYGLYELETAIGDVHLAVRTASEGMESFADSVLSSINAINAGAGMNSMTAPELEAHADGGLLRGGTGVRDDLYIGTIDGRAQLAMGGEYIMPQAQTRKHLPELEAMRADRYLLGGPARGTLPSGPINRPTTNPPPLSTTRTGDDAAATAKFMEDILFQIAQMGRSGLEQDMTELHRRMAETVARAKELGASEKDLADIRKLESLQVLQLAAANETARRDFMRGVTDQIDAYSMTDQQLAIRETVRAMDEQLAKAKELGVSEAGLAQIRKLQGLKAAEIMNKGLRTAITSMGSFRESMADTAAGVDRSADAQRKLFAALTQAKRGDFSGVEAIGDVLKDISINKEDYASAADYARDYWRTMSAVSALERITTAQVQPQGYADGGAFSGGWRLVGEQGPELEYTGPSRIYSNEQSRALVDNSEVVSEIRELRKEMVASGYQVSKNTGRIFRTLDKWEGIGMPLERAA